LLKGSLAGLAAGSVAVIPAQARQPPAADPADLQFQETDHVRTFYELARR
jgi:hypothetical protein